MFRLDIPTFVPHRSLRSGNLQTITSVFRKVPAESERTLAHRVPTTLGDHLILHQSVVTGASQNDVDSQRQVLLLHGLGGCSRSGYMVRVSQKLADVGIQAWRMDSRGSGAGISEARYHHHAGRSEDVESSVKFIASQHPNSPITIIGFSLGASVLLNWLGEEYGRSNSRVDSAIAVAPPINLGRCNEGLKRGWSRFYDLYFAKVMMQRVRERRLARPDMINPPIRFAPETLDQFDRQFTAPAGGFDDLQDYYDKASSWYKLIEINKPTLLVVDKRDPVIPFDMFRENLFSSTTQVVTTSGGGHLGYYGRTSQDPDACWLDWRLVDWVVEASQK